MTAGRCALCGYHVGGVGLLCDQCWRGREAEVPRYMTEPLSSRLDRLATWERTGRPSRVPHRYTVMRPPSGTL